MTSLQPKFLEQGQFPNTRLRRNRHTPWLRRLVAETELSANDLILSMFVRDSLSQSVIPSMPGVKRHTTDEIVDFVGKAYDLKIPAICLFPYYERAQRKDNVLHMLTPENIYCEAIRKIKSAFPDIGIIVDVALDCYTTHGQDGIVKDGQILNDQTIKVISDYAVVLAQAGADIIAPSEMMDGRVGAIRHRLDDSGFQDTAIMSYAAKYASNFYGPFRDAVGSKSCLAEADKNTYLMDYRNAREALREVALDIQESADMVMIKPGLPYLDIVKSVKDTFGVPTFVYHVSGEYAMLKAAAQNGWLDYDKCLHETLTACKRAGADGILTYGAIDAATLIKEGF
jgi:porphobilinogen synthase